MLALVWGTLFGDWPDCHFHCVTILQQLPLTCTLKGFFCWLKPGFWWTSITGLHGFSLEKILSPFSSTWENMLAFEPFLQY